MASLMSLATEIRLAIYSDLLIQRDGLFDFKVHYDPRLRSTRMRPTNPTADLCPALLRVSKQVYDEAISILYSKNSFRFSDAHSDSDWEACHPMAKFFDKIGAHNASLLRHVCVSILPDSFPDGPPARELQFWDLDVLCNHPNICRGLTTLELALTVYPSHFQQTSSFPFSNKELELVSERLKCFPSLQQVKIDLLLLEWEEESSVEYIERNWENLPFGQDLGPPSGRDFLVKQLSDRGWAVNVTEIPPTRIVYDDPDDQSWWDPDIWADELERQRDEEDYYRERQLEGYRRGYADDGGPA